MNKLKIAFTDTWDSCINYFVEMLGFRYDVEVSKDAEFLLFCDENFGNNNLNYSKNDIVKILYTGENRRPERYDSHYAITFDHNFQPWHYRLPLYVLDMWAIPYLHNVSDRPYNYLIKPKKTTVEDKEEFCAFVHRNPGNPIRNDFFKKLSSYKKVNSAGPLLNNTNLNLKDVKSKIDYFSKHKFSLCFENSSHPGYVTEKILHGFYGNTIPIYWGSKSINRDFNPCSFLNYHDFVSEDHLIKKIIELDNNDDMYNEVLAQPKFTSNVPNDCVVIDNFLNWFDAVVYTKRFAR